MGRRVWSDRARRLCFDPGFRALFARDRIVLVFLAKFKSKVSGLAALRNVGTDRVVAAFRTLSDQISGRLGLVLIRRDRPRRQAQNPRTRSSFSSSLLLSSTNDSNTPITFTHNHPTTQTNHHVRPRLLSPFLLPLPPLTRRVSFPGLPKPLLRRSPPPRPPPPRVARLRPPRRPPARRRLLSPRPVTARRRPRRPARRPSASSSSTSSSPNGR